MVLDTSALIAILQNEPESEELLSKLEQAKSLRISAATVAEAGIVMHARYGDAGELEVDNFIHRLNVDVIPLTAEHAELARYAYRKFGKGNHKAGLNFGDCFSFALAVSLNEPLLFVGDDFSETDVLT